MRSAESLLKDSKVFCMVPWVHLNIRADGKVCHCCMASLDQAVGSLRQSTLDDIWNAPGIRAIRAAMLAGRPCPECQKCLALEAAGAPSPRLDRNREHARHFPLVKSTPPDGTVAEFRLAFLDVRFSNVCNFSCDYCSADNSTTWQAEHRPPRGQDRWGGATVLAAARDPQELWRQLWRLVPHVEHFYFAGGEPLLMPEHYRLLDMLLAQGRRDAALCYSTNFSATTFQGVDVMKLWDEFDNVSIAASLDASGRRGEYIRKHQRWEQVLRDRERMFSACPRVRFYIAPTLTAMNVLHLPDFHREWLEKGYLKPQDFYINILQEPAEYCVQILPGHLKRRVLDRYEEHIAFLAQRYGDAAAAAAEQFRGAAKFLMAGDLGHLLNKFQRRTRGLDRARDGRFVDVFPEMAELLTG